ncbi:hypothetical protein [Mesorhizobium argentiipisi]|uniref:Uncharacterized protein n=1 Tax=Mesorhizobium argentiipisi TaxID=3015175 RepID=A0ABU8KBH9_9HYPH
MAHVDWYYQRVAPLKRGVDHVTGDDIAAADVGRMTVFNHVPRKEDMSPIATQWAAKSRANRSAISASLIAERSPFVEFSAQSQRFVEPLVRSHSSVLTGGSPAVLCERELCFA